MTLKQKTVSGLIWSFIDNFAKQGLNFIIGIILARLLSPREFGLIGMITVFIAISQSLIDSGFTQALIRKNNCTQKDYSTVFFFNFAISLLLYLILFFSANLISRFYNEPQLTLILRVLGIGLIINGFTIVQRARLTKNIDFKLQTKISITASIFSGIIGIYMAFVGFGVWSLVTKTIGGFAFSSFLLWIWNKWKPSFVFSFISFKEMFSFGSRLLLSGLIETLYRNIYLLIIGKYFTATDLGYFTRADQFNNLASQNITAVIQRVSYPVLSTIQDDKIKLKKAYEKLIKSTMLITFVLMISMATLAKPLILVLIGEKWLPSVIYLQLLCFVGMLYPLHAINLNMLNVQGRSDLFLRLEILKKIMAIPIIIIGILLGINEMIISMILISVISFFLNSYYSGKQIGYSSFQQLKDIIPSFLLSVFVGVSMFLFGYYINMNITIKLLIQIILGFTLTITIAEVIKMENYLYLKNIVFERIVNKRKKHE